jgi:RNA polymerase sigma factor (sigma-70 family)
MTTQNPSAGPINLLLQELSRIAAGQGSDQPPDGLLLERFLARRDASAFTVLVQRYGSMVWGVCRRQLPRESDAADAFQATFVLLARKAGSICKLQAVGSWLHGVAYRVTRRLRDSEAGRRGRHGVPIPRDPMSEVTWRELRLALDEELAGLPDRHRVPLVLCYLEGKTQEAAARQLGCPRGRLWRRLERGRELLRVRLTRRGLSLSGGLFALLLSGNPSPAGLSAGLVDAAVRSALELGAGRPVAGAVSSRVAALAAGGLEPVVTTKLAVGLFLTAALTMAISGAGVLAYRARASANIAESAATPPAPDRGDPAERKQPDRRENPLGPNVPFSCLRFSGDGKVLACARLDNTICLLEVPTGRELRRLGPPEPPHPQRDEKVVSCMAFSADGKALAALYPGQGVVLWDVEKGREMGRLNVDLPHEAALAFSPDGKTFATGGGLQPVRLWEVATGRERGRFTGHQTAVTSLAFSPDGRTLVAGTADTTALRWDVTRPGNGTPPKGRLTPRERERFPPPSAEPR